MAVENSIGIPELAVAPCILDRLGDEVARMGVAGERRVIQLIYLVVTTRLLDRIVSLAVKGPSSAGKSFLVASVLRFFPPLAFHALSSMSEKALIYDETDLRHRMLVIYEAAGMESELQTYLIRSLLSEGLVRYTTVEAGKGGIKPRTIEREGPTGLITTTTAVKLHAENETRLVSVTVSDSPAQTREILRAQARESEPHIDLEPWYHLQEWLAKNIAPVRIPYLGTLAEAMPTVAVRLRRDFPTVKSLIAAHALLHQANRERDADGAIIASIDDYSVVRDLVADLVADAAEQTVSPTVRETVDAVSAMDMDLDVGVTVTAVATELGLDKSSAHRRVRQALERGYLKNLEDRRFRPARLVAGDPMPAERDVLPQPDELERLHGCTPVGGETLTDASEVRPVDPDQSGERHDAPSEPEPPLPPEPPATMQPAVDEDPPLTVQAAHIVFADLLPDAEDPQLQAWLEAPLPTPGGAGWEQ